MTSIQETPQVAGRAASAGGQVILLTLATGQFLMALDSSVMNVSIAQVAKDVGTMVTAFRARSRPTRS